MKTIGLLGGMTVESSKEYYQIINETSREILGGMSTVPSILYSVNFGEIEVLLEKDDWDAIEVLLTDTAKVIQNAGADCLVICANTMHRFADKIQQKLDIPIIHLIDSVAEAVKKQNIDTVALLGTRFTMTQDFYKGRLTEKHNLNVLVPDDEDIRMIHRVLIEELGVGQIREESADAFWGVLNKLQAKGATAAILGCTEIPLLVKPRENGMPLFDTVHVHATAAVDWALKQ